MVCGGVCVACVWCVWAVCWLLLCLPAPGSSQTHTEGTVNGRGERVIISRGSDVRMQCPLEVVGKSVDVMFWSKDDAPLVEGTKYQVEVTGSGYFLKVVNMSEGDEGTYHCVGYTLGTAGRIALNVDVTGS